MGVCGGGALGVESADFGVGVGLSLISTSASASFAFVRGALCVGVSPFKRVRLGAGDPSGSPSASVSPPRPLFVLRDLALALPLDLVTPRAPRAVASVGASTGSFGGLARFAGVAGTLSCLHSSSSFSSFCSSSRIRFLPRGFLSATTSAASASCGEFGGVLMGEMSPGPGCTGDPGSDGCTVRIIAGNGVEAVGIPVVIGGGRLFLGEPCVGGACCWTGWWPWRGGRECMCGTGWFIWWG